MDETLVVETPLGTSEAPMQALAGVLAQGKSDIGSGAPPVCGERLKCEPPDKILRRGRVLKHIEERATTPLRKHKWRRVPLQGAHVT